MTGNCLLYIFTLENDGIYYNKAFVELIYE